MSRSVIYSFLGHFVMLGALLALGFTRARPEGPAVYNVSIVPGVAGEPGSGVPGSGGKAAVGVAGMVGQPGAIGAPASISAKPPKGTVLVQESNKKPSALRKDTSTTNSPDQIAMRVYGTGGTIGGGGSGSGGLGGGSGRPATAFEIAMNNKIVSQWNEDLWKTMPDRLSATVKFLIAGDGSVSNVVVFESSGNTGFDQAARRAIELATIPSPVAFGIPGNLHEARVTFVNRPD